MNGAGSPATGRQGRTDLPGKLYQFLQQMMKFLQKLDVWAGPTDICHAAAEGDLKKVKRCVYGGQDVNSQASTLSALDVAGWICPFSNEVYERSLVDFLLSVSMYAE